MFFPKPAAFQVHPGRACGTAEFAMKTLHGHLAREVLATLGMTVAVFTFVLLLGNVLKEIFGLLVNRQATPLIVLQALALLIPYVLVFSLPMGLLAATLLAFGRFSADQELTAARAGGVSLVALIAPILVLSLAFSGLCSMLNLHVGPASRQAYKQLLFQLGVERANVLLTEDRFIDDIPGCIIYVRKIRGDNLEDVHFYKLDKREIVERVTAPSARIEREADGQTLTLYLRDAITEVRLARAANPPADTAPSDPESANRPVEMENEHRWEGFKAGELTEKLNFATRSMGKRPLKLSEMTFPQLREELRKREQEGLDITPVLVPMHRQWAFSFASFSFALIGIPLGIRAHRRETTVGLAIALVLVMIYYVFLITGQALETRAELMPWFIVWVPNFLFQGIGAILLWRVNRHR